jgi:uncharacterized phiE125 gp8 family phage protein
MAEPVSLALARAQCSIIEGDTTWDALLNIYIPAAREWVERYSGVTLMSQTFTEYLDEFDDYLTLSRWPVTAINEIGYLDSDDLPAVFVDYTLMNSIPVRLYPLDDGWPTLGTNGEISIEYVAGYAEGDEPSGLVQAMLVLIAHWFNNREAVGQVTGAVAFSVESLCDRYRIPVA